MTRFMTRARFFSQGICFIGLVTLVYSVLLVMAAGCALAPADHAHNHQQRHDEQGSSAHISLCTWACQATADTAVVVGPPSTVKEPVMEFSHLVFIPPILPISSSTVHARAPPSAVSV